MSERIIELGVGGRIVVHVGDRQSHGLTYVEFEGTKEPDCDGVATLDDDEVRALIAALQEVTA